MARARRDYYINKSNTLFKTTLRISVILYIEMGQKMI
jgi:hypothetical protein